jgi:hypothetical protein
VKSLAPIHFTHCHYQANRSAKMASKQAQKRLMKVSSQARDFTLSKWEFIHKLHQQLLSFISLLSEMNIFLTSFFWWDP